MIGPFSDINENLVDYNKDIIDYNKFKRYLEKQDNLQIKKHKLISINYALNSFQETIKNINNLFLKHIGAEVFISNSSHTISSHILDKKLAHLINSSLYFANSISIEIDGVNDSFSFKNKSPEKLKYLLDIIRKILCRNIGFFACFEYEFNYGYRNSNKSITNKIRPISHITRKKQPHIFIRLSDETPDDCLKKIFSVIIESKIVNAIILDANLDKNSNQNIINYSKFAQPNSASNIRLKEIKNLFGPDIPIISSGGVYTGEDAFYRIKSGADFVLVDDAYWIRGPYCLEKILNELAEVMLLKNIKNIKEIKERGKLIKEIKDDYLKDIYK